MGKAINMFGIYEKDDISSTFDIGEKDMEKQLKIKKKRKFNFDKLFPTPKNNENMGMDDFGMGEPFKGIL